MALEVNYFRKKSSIVDVRLSSKHASERDGAKSFGQNIGNGVSYSKPKSIWASVSQYKN